MENKDKVRKKKKQVSISKILSTARTEYMKWICDERMVLLIVMFVFIQTTIVSPLIKNSQMMNSPINILEPFVAAVNSRVMIIIIPALFLALFSDFPRTDGNTLFFLPRVGKINWILGQFLFAVYAIVSYMAVIFAFCTVPVLASGFWANGWSLVTTKFALEFPEQSQNFGASLIQKNIYHQLSPYRAVLVSTGLVMLYLLLIALIMMLFNTLKKKIFGILMVAVTISFGSLFYMIELKIMWIFPMAHAALESHFTKYFRDGGVPLFISIFYFVIVCLLLVAASMICIKRQNFESLQEVD